MHKQVWGLALSLLIGITGCSTFDKMTGSEPPAPTKVVDGMLTNSAGMTLYTFDKDIAGSGKSVCNGPCAGLWPPLLAGADAKAGGDYTIITRDDGARQWAFKGKPLYLWSKDTKPGERSGDGFNNVWRVIKV